MPLRNGAQACLLFTIIQEREQAKDFCGRYSSRAHSSSSSSLSVCGTAAATALEEEGGRVSDRDTVPLLLLSSIDKLCRKLMLYLYACIIALKKELHDNQLSPVTDRDRQRNNETHLR